MKEPGAKKALSVSEIKTIKNKAEEHAKAFKDLVQELSDAGLTVILNPDHTLYIEKIESFGVKPVTQPVGGTNATNGEGQKGPA